MPNNKPCDTCGQPKDWISQALCCNKSCLQLCFIIFVTITMITAGVFAIYAYIPFINNKLSISFEVTSDGKYSIRSNNIVIQQLTIPSQLPFVKTGINTKKHLLDGKELFIRANGCVSTGTFFEIVSNIGDDKATYDFFVKSLNEGVPFKHTSHDIILDFEKHNKITFDKTTDFSLFVLKHIFQLQYNNYVSSMLRGPSGKQFQDSGNTPPANYLPSAYDEYAKKLRLAPHSEWGCLVGFFVSANKVQDNENSNIFDVLKEDRRHNSSKIQVFEVGSTAHIIRNKSNIQIIGNNKKYSIDIYDPDMDLYLGVNDALILESEDLLLPENSNPGDFNEGDREFRKHLKKYIDLSKIYPYYTYYAGNTGHFNVNITIE